MDFYPKDIKEIAAGGGVEEGRRDAVMIPSCLFGVVNLECVEKNATFATNSFVSTMKIFRNLTVITVTTAFLAVSVPASGRPLSFRQAKANALAFIQKWLFKEQMTEGRRSVVSNDSMTLAAQDDHYYVFNIGSNNGYVIASGDDCAPAVLGYSDKGHVSAAMPDNMKAWLDEYDQQIKMRKALMLAAANDESPVAEREAIAPMVTTKWGQDSPFNLKCPSYFPLMHCPTGCVATAMSQILYYHRKSSVNKTAADIEGYTTPTNQYNIEFVRSGAKIDWDNMLDSYSRLSPQYRKEAVATLMSYCGAALRTDYRQDGASANSADVAQTMVKYFDYSSEATYIDRNQYTTDEWEQIIYDELKKGYPVYYKGQKGNYAHGFVCDGYDGNGYFHINWGWSGESDGFYLLSVLRPEIEITASGYTLYQKAVVGLVPNGVYARLTQKDLALTGTKRFSAGAGKSAGVDMTMTVQNNFRGGYSFNTAMGLYKNGELLQVLPMSTFKDFASGSSKTVRTTLSVPADLEEGDYLLKPLSKQVAQDDWKENDGVDTWCLTLQVSNGILSFEEGDHTATGMAPIMSADKPNGNFIYDLNGRRVKTPHRGIFIKNRKKIIFW